METDFEFGRWYPGHHVAANGGKVALVLEPAVTSMTCGALDAAANRFSHFPASGGIRERRPRVPVVNNELRYPSLWWGAHYAGLVAELFPYVQGRLASVKCPRRIDVRDEMPREPKGKLVKRLLRDEYVGSGRPGLEQEVGGVTR